jgi:N-acetylglutamate synthase-like GNAT family acetyltransferase
MQLKKSPIAHQDEPFLFELYSSTRSDELSRVPWGDEQKQAFLLHQFQAQQQYYLTKYPDALFQVIKLDDDSVGRLYIAELIDEIRIIDITILTEFRGKNIGTTLLEEILIAADKKNKAVQIYLETNDQSANLFARLGFAPVTDEGIHQLWRRPAKSRAKTIEA